MLALPASWYQWGAWSMVLFSSPFLSPPAVWAPAHQSLWPLRYFLGESGATIWNLTLCTCCSSGDICAYQAHVVRRLFSTSVVFDSTVSGWLTSGTLSRCLLTGEILSSAVCIEYIPCLLATLGRLRNQPVWTSLEPRQPWGIVRAHWCQWKDPWICCFFRQINKGQGNKCETHWDRHSYLCCIQVTPKHNLCVHNTLWDWLIIWSILQWITHFSKIKI